MDLDPNKQLFIHTNQPMHQIHQKEFVPNVCIFYIYLMKPHKLQDHTVTKDVAVFRTTQWRQLYKDTMKVPDKEILRAFYIPIEDIIGLYEFYMEHQVNISGVRGYFGHDPLEPITPDHNIDMLLVPVDINGKDIVDPPASLGLGDGGSTIYDFTSPCPTNCDTGSILYSDQNVKK